jgi:hypothetical protein
MEQMNTFLQLLNLKSIKEDIKTRRYILCQTKVKVKVLQLKIMVRKVTKRLSKTKVLKSNKKPELNKEFGFFYNCKCSRSEKYSNAKAVEKWYNS